MPNPKSLLQLGALTEFAGRSTAAANFYEEGITAALRQAELQSLAEGTQEAFSRSYVETAEANVVVSPEAYTSSFPVGQKRDALNYKARVDASERASYKPSR